MAADAEGVGAGEDKHFELYQRKLSMWGHHLKWSNCGRNRLQKEDDDLSCEHP